MISKLQRELGAKILPPRKTTRAKTFYEVATINQHGTIESRDFATLGKAKGYFLEQQAKGFNVQPIAKYKGDEFIEEIYF